MKKTKIKRSITIAALGKKFNYGAHINAFTEFFITRGFNVNYILNKEFYPPKFYKHVSFMKSDDLFLIFPFKEMLFYSLIRWIFNKKTYYWFHEPFESYTIYRESGNSFFWITQFFLKSLYSYFTCYFCNIVFLPSDSAIKNYTKSKLFFKKIKFVKFPLIYPDRIDFTKKEKLVSYIGTISKDHAFDSFIKMIMNNESLLFKYNFKLLIATSSRIDKVYLDRLESLSINTQIIHSRSIKEKDMDSYYSRTLFLWNAYRRTTQSGVLVNGFRHNCIPIFQKESFNYDYRNICLLVNSNKYLINLDDFNFVLKNIKIIYKLISDLYLKNYSYKSVLRSQIFRNEV